MPLYEEKFICPFSIRFSQERIRPTFQDGRVVEKSMAAVEAVEWPIENSDAYDVVLRTPFPPISIIRWRPKMREHDGTTITNEDGTVVLGEPCWFTFDNRRLYCLQAAAARHWPRRAACVVHVMRDLPTNKCTPRKFRTTDSGNSVNISRRYDLVPKAVWSWCQATRCTAPGEVPDDADEVTRLAHEHIMKDSQKEDWDELVDVPADVEEICSNFEALEPLPQKPPLPPTKRTGGMPGLTPSSSSSSRQQRQTPQQQESPQERQYVPQPKPSPRAPNPLQYSQHPGYNFPMDFGMDYGYGFGLGHGNPYGALNGYNPAVAQAAAAAAAAAAANGGGLNHIAALAAMQQDLDTALAALHHAAANPYAAASAPAAYAAAARAAAARGMASQATAAAGPSRRKPPPEPKPKAAAGSDHSRSAGGDAAGERANGSTAGAASAASKSVDGAGAGQAGRTSGAGVAAAASAPSAGATHSSAAKSGGGDSAAATADGAADAGPQSKDVPLFEVSESLLPVPKEGEANGDDDDETCAQQ
mmetsp:Transcript_130974/g.378942  ORF Transcript_130974/g.378942 Transcript_130974/m.378942 type:complete len:531 (+) Transcript_130974:194-1786(+)